MKTEIIPMVVGALEVIKTGSEKLVCEIRGNINFGEIQKTALLRIIKIKIIITIIIQFRNLSQFVVDAVVAGYVPQW